MSVFFFKQKTAYEMRISDWSSDVCSSDLARIRRLSWPALLDVDARQHFGADRRDETSGRDEPCRGDHVGGEVAIILEPRNLVEQARAGTHEAGARRHRRMELAPLADGKASCRESICTYV